MEFMEDLIFVLFQAIKMEYQVNTGAFLTKMCIKLHIVIN